MAFLMLMYQKMKLQRKENQLTLKQLRFSSQVDRMQKKVDKRQKYYDKLKKQIERQAECYKKSMNIMISDRFGLGTNSVNLMNPYGSNGAVQIALQNMDLSKLADMFGDNKPTDLDAFKTAIKGGQLCKIPYNMTKEEAEKQGFKNVPEDGYKTGQLYDFNTGTLYSAQEANIYDRLQQQAQMQVSMMQSQAQSMKCAYDNNVSIWVDAQLEQVEYQEECEMDMLAEEQSDMEAEKESIELQLKRVQEEKKNIEQALNQSVQDSAPKFGLG